MPQSVIVLLEVTPLLGFCRGMIRLSNGQVWQQPAYAYVPGVVSKARMVDNIHAAADGRTDMVLIARCLAPTPNNSYTEMLDRAVAYAEAGADAVWIGLPTTQD